MSQPEEENEFNIDEPVETNTAVACNLYTLKIYNSLEYGTPTHFISSRFNICNSLAFLIYRYITTLYFLVMVAFIPIYNIHGIKILIFFSYWVYALFIVQMVLLTSAATYYYYRNTVPSRMPVILKAIWVLENISGPGSLVVSLGFWISVYKPGSNIQIATVTVHGLNSLFLFLDMFVSYHPVKLGHVWHVTAFTLGYVIFSLVYTLCGGTNSQGQTFIYSFLDYKGKTTTTLIAISIAIFILLPFLHFLRWLIFFLLALITKKVKGRSVEPVEV